MKKIIINSAKHGIKEVLVDDEDYDFLTQFKWGVHKNNNSFYVVRETKFNKHRVCYKIHRVVMNVTGKNTMIDHIDLDGLNNQKSNLRLCNKSQNGANRRPSRNSTSKYLGVSWSSHAKKWVAQIKKNYKRQYYKYFDSEIEAAEAYKEKAKELHGEFASSHIPNND